jgi:hypothetical protein
LIKLKSETIFYSEKIPIEPEPGNAGAGNRNLKRVSVLPELFFYLNLIPVNTYLGKGIPISKKKIYLPNSIATHRLSYSWLL